MTNLLETECQITAQNPLISCKVPTLQLSLHIEDLDPHINTFVFKKKKPQKAQHHYPDHT